MQGDQKVVGKLETTEGLTVGGWSTFTQRSIYQNGGNSSWTVENAGGKLRFYPKYAYMGPAIHFYDNANVSFPGKVSIGVCQANNCDEQNVGGALLAVAGPITAWSKISVISPGGTWPDYVFQRSYRLRPLTEVARYVQAFHHLPDVPSAAQVQANGIELAEMNATLLRKVEELTLYLLQLQAANQALTKRVAKLESTN